jgi:hypothetical protein
MRNQFIWISILTFLVVSVSCSGPPPVKPTTSTYLQVGADWGLFKGDVVTINNFEVGTAQLSNITIVWCPPADSDRDRVKVVSGKGAISLIKGLFGYFDAVMLRFHFLGDGTNVTVGQIDVALANPTYAKTPLAPRIPNTGIDVFSEDLKSPRNPTGKFTIRGQECAVRLT